MFSDEDLGLNEPDPIPLRPTKEQAAKAFLEFKKAADEMERLKAYPRMTAGMRADFTANLRKHTAAETLLNRYFANGRTQCRKASARKPNGPRSESVRPESKQPKRPSPRKSTRSSSRRSSERLSVGSPGM